MQDIEGDNPRIGSDILSWREVEDLNRGSISKKIWDQMCANTLDLENATVEEIKAGLDPDFVPEGWVDPPLLLRRSSSYLSQRRRPSVQVSYPH